jgi:hypothetical protein
VTVDYPNALIRDEVATAAIRKDPDASVREIARRCGVSHPYVLKLKQRLAVQDEAEELGIGRRRPKTPVEIARRQQEDIDALVLEVNRLMDECDQLKRERDELEARLAGAFG